MMACGAVHMPRQIQNSTIEGCVDVFLVFTVVVYAMVMSLAGLGLASGERLGSLIPIVSNRLSVFICQL